MYHGWLNIDKPIGATSADMVSILRKVFSMRKIGHAGTLDPMATGVLPLACGEATKTIRFMQDLEKEYCFTLKFGASTDSFDRTGEVVETTNNMPSEEQIFSVLPRFIGDIMQVPPKFSAIKVGGVRAYKRARHGEDVKLEPRQIKVYALALEAFDRDKCEAIFRVLCSKGTYVRSLGHDIALALDSFGHLTSLRRTKVGAFNEKNIKSIEKVKELVHNNKIRLLSIEDTFQDMPFLDFSIEDKQKIKNGVSVSVSKKDGADLNQGEAFARMGSELIAIGRIKDNMFRPIRGFNFN